MIIRALQFYKKASQAWEAGSIPVFRSYFKSLKNNTLCSLILHFHLLEQAKL